MADDKTYGPKVTRSQNRLDSEKDARGASRRVPRSSTVMPVHPPTTQAIIQAGYGTPERVFRLEEIEVPPIGAGDVLLEHHASGKIAIAL